MNDPKRIGLVAGWGDLPVRVATSLKAQGYEIYCLAIKGHADPVLSDICDSYRVFGMGKMGAQIRFFKKAGITEATMAGKVFKTLLYKKMAWLSHFPDLACWRHFYPIFMTKTKDQRDDTLLNTVTELYAANGIKFSPATDFSPELLVNEGPLTRRRLTDSQQKDVEFGWRMAKEMGRLDIGQSVAVMNQSVMAVEAIEGTDACIRRAGELCARGFSVIKVAKPNQDMRFDVPTIGEGTIRTLHEAGGKVLAIEADKTIVLNQAATVELADQLGVVIVALADPAANRSVA